MRGSLAGLVVLIVAVAGCVPGTYYDINDRYIIGMRWFDRDRYEETIHYWKPLAEAGDCDAQYRYGTLFAVGAGVPKSMSTAIDWWTRAANQGQYRAQAALANAYAREVFQEGTFLRKIVMDCRQGCEVPDDPVTAYYWLRLAGASVPPAMHPQFRQAVGAWSARLENKLTVEQRAEAEARAAAWQPSPARCTPRVLK